MSSANLAPAPLSLSPSLAEIPFGRYRGPIADIGTEQWDARYFARRRFQRKAWMFAGVSSPDFFWGMAIVDAGYLGLAFTYYFDRKTKLFVEEKAMRPFAFPRNYVPGLNKDWELRSGRRTWSVRPESAGWRFVFEGKRLQFDLSVPHSFDGLTALAPALHRPFHSTYKLAAVPVSGVLKVDGEERAMGESRAVLDFSLGYPARRTRWNWVALSGRTQDGRSVGINAVEHFNQDLENGLWIEGDLVALPPIRIVPGEHRAKDLWRIQTEGGDLELEFKPEGARAENVLLGLIQSRYVQPFGSFHGSIRHRGERLELEGLGIVEEHFAYW